MEETPNTTCSICFSSYDGKDRRPLVLPCSHSFCQECLQQLDRDRNKQCPCCRESWQSLKLTDLTFCRQLIPEQAHVKTSSSGVALCEHHNVCLTLWCDACQCLLCIKCIPVNHSECELRLITDKRADLLKKSAVILLAIKSINESDILKLNEDLKKYKKITWHEEIKEGLKKLEKSNTKLSIERSVNKFEKTIEKIETADNSATLFMLVTKAYAATRDGTPESFISHFMESKNSLAKLQAAAADRIDSKRKATELKEGREWTLLGGKALESASETLTKTSVRPSAISVKLHDSERIKNIEKFVAVLFTANCEIKLLLLDCFWKVSGSSRYTTKKIVDKLKQIERCRLVELWGHLDAAAVKLLPNTVRRVGLVLASADDMEAVNALQEAVEQSNLQRMDLSIHQTFRVESWDLQWKCSPFGNLTKVDGLNFLQYRVTRLALHFPNIKYSHIVWMTNIINKITSGRSHVSCVQWLYLPGTTVTPDAVLGVLRDAGLSCEVHLPPDLTEKQDRQEVTMQYKKYKCTIVWDAEYEAAAVAEPRQSTKIDTKKHKNKENKEKNRNEEKTK